MTSVETAPAGLDSSITRLLRTLKSRVASTEETRDTLLRSRNEAIYLNKETLICLIDDEIAVLDNQIVQLRHELQTIPADIRAEARADDRFWHSLED